MVKIYESETVYFSTADERHHIRVRYGKDIFYVPKGYTHNQITQIIEDIYFGARKI